LEARLTGAVANTRAAGCSFSRRPFIGCRLPINEA
jgi:hypothetical protein